MHQLKRIKNHCTNSLHFNLNVFQDKCSSISYIYEICLHVLYVHDSSTFSNLHINAILITPVSSISPLPFASLAVRCYSCLNSVNNVTDCANTTDCPLGQASTRALQGFRAKISTDIEYSYREYLVTVQYSSRLSCHDEKIQNREAYFVLSLIHKYVQ